MIFEADVVNAFRYILGRDPESREVVERFREMRDPNAMRMALVHSPESCRRNNMPLAGRHVGGPPMSVEFDVEMAVTQKILDETRQTWVGLGHEDPYWSVLSSDEYRSDNLSSKTIENFYGSGRRTIEVVERYFARAGLGTTELQTVLDYGCGLGRLTLAAAQVFPRVIGVDISRPHLDAAKARAERVGIGNVEFTLLESLGSFRDLPPVDLFFSFIALQHSPPPVIMASLEALLAKVNRGGYALFQVPTYRAGYSYRVGDDNAQEGRFEMHVVPQGDIFRLADRHDFRLLEVQEDGMAGVWEFMSNTFFMQKRS